MEGKLRRRRRRRESLNQRSEQGWDAREDAP